MYNLLRRLVLGILKVPPEPEDPAGDADKLMVFRASKNFYRYKLWMWLIGRLFVVPIQLAMVIGAIVFAMAVENEIGTPLLIAAGLVLGVLFIISTVFSYVTLRLDYEMRWYKVTDRSLRIREGVWFVREMTMTFDNIQNISLSQGPIQRALKIADLQVQTAGGGGAATEEAQESAAFFNMHLGFFRGIDNAEDVLKIMQERLRRARGSGLGDRDEDEAPEEASETTVPAGREELLAAARSLLEEAQAFRRTAEATARN